MSDLYLIPEDTPKEIRHLIDWLYDNDFLLVADLDDLQVATREMADKWLRDNDA